MPVAGEAPPKKTKLSKDDAAAAAIADFDNRVSALDHVEWSKPGLLWNPVLHNTTFRRVLADFLKKKEEFDATGECGLGWCGVSVVECSGRWSGVEWSGVG